MRVSFALAPGARCLLLGANGAGKSTLLRLIAGRHMLAHDVVRVLGRPAFHDASLAGDVAFLGGPFPFSADISVRDVLAARPGVDPKRRAAVLAMLDVDPGWRMHQVSDGQRRRVQLLLDLERTLRVILLDEVTAELDVLARADLLALPPPGERGRRHRAVRQPRAGRPRGFRHRGGVPVARAAALLLRPSARRWPRRRRGRPARPCIACARPGCGRTGLPRETGPF